MDERISNLEDRINSIQVSLDVLPDVLTRCIQQQFEYNNMQTSFGQHMVTPGQQQSHYQTSVAPQQQNSSHSATLIKQPIQPQSTNQAQPMALTHQQQQPSSFQDGDFASLQIASSPSPNNPSGATLANSTTIMSGQQKSAANVPYTNNQPAWQYPTSQQHQNKSGQVVPSTTSTNWQTNNPAPTAPVTLGQSKQNLQSHMINRPSPSVHSNQAALISAPTSSSAVTMLSSSPNAQPTNSQLLSAQTQAQQLPQGQQQHTAPPPAYHIAAQSTAGRNISSNIPTIAPPPPLPPRSQHDPSAKSMSSSLSGAESVSNTSGTPNVGFQPQQSSVRNRHSHHQEQQHTS